MVRAVAGTGSARVAVSDLGRAAAAVAAAADAARRAGRARPARPQPYGVAAAAAAPAIAGLWHDATAAWDEGARRRRAGRIMDAARAAGGTAAGVLTAAVTELAVVTSAGQRAYAAATEAGFALTVRVGDGLLATPPTWAGMPARWTSSERAARGRRPGRPRRDRVAGARRRARRGASAGWPPAS